jgi:hypothetical protein
VRVNGFWLWQRSIKPPDGWQSGAIDLSPWAVQTILLELIADSLGQHILVGSDSWAELNLDADATANCLATVSARCSKTDSGPPT